MSDIPLIDAIFMWTPADSRHGPDFAVTLLGHADYYDKDWLELTLGACNRFWAEDCSDEQRLDYAVMVLLQIAALDGVPMAKIHSEMQVVPEYRELMAGGVGFQVPIQQAA